METQATIATTLEDCRQQLSELQSLSVGVCAAMREISRELLETGRAPSNASIEQLADFRLKFENLQKSIAHPGLAPSFDNGESDEGCSMLAIHNDLESQAIIRTTLARLESITLIQHVDQLEFLPWQRCMADRTRLQEELLSTPVTQARVAAEQFLSPETPLNAIVTLVAEGAELTDERWSMLLDSVSAAYGREVTTAIARGKLVLMSGTRA